MLTPIALVLAGIATQERPVEAFHRLDLSGGIQATLVKGPKAALTLKGETKDLERLESFVKDGALVVRQKDRSGIHWFEHRGQVTATVTAPQIDGLDISGGCSVTGEIFGGTNCSIDVSGGVDINLKSVACTALNLDASGGAELNLQGVTSALKIDASGGVKLKLDGLDAKTAVIEASGGVNGTVGVSDTLSFDGSGGVNIKVKGHPKVLSSDTSGAAQVTYVDGAKGKPEQPASAPPTRTTKSSNSCNTSLNDSHCRVVECINEQCTTKEFEASPSRPCECASRALHPAPPAAPVMP
jgi:Putative auto-transporter adhesin, head GIN domain